MVTLGKRRRGRRLTGTLAAAILAGWTGIAGAQGAPPPGVEVLGARAQGMAGAFVAVADDATAIYWNPAGLATGDFVSLALEHSDREGPSGAPGLRSDAVLIGTPPLGAGYYRIGSTHHVPVTVVQSIGDHLNVGGAVKGVWGEGLDGATHGRFDVDLGVIVRTEAWRIGLVARDLTAPAFGDEVPGVERPRLDRVVRVGGAIFPRDGLIVALDADLTKQTGAGPARRAVAAGVEQRAGSRLLLRGGVRAQTTGDARPSASGGASIRLTSLIWIDGHGTAGGDDADRGWSVGLRARF